MTSHVCIGRADDGRPVACKRSTSADGADRIRAEAERLATIDHPGVARFVEVREDEAGPTLVTEYVGSRTLASIGPVTTERAARLVGDLATTVADLHAQGLVHGAVCPEHVLVAGDRTVLCGFSASPDGLGPPDDVHGIGTTLRALVARELEEEPIPDRRPWRRTPWQGYRQRALLTLADQATDDEAARRPGARALAEAVRAAGGAPAPARDEAARSGLRHELADLVAIRLRRVIRPDRGRREPDRRRPVVRTAALGALGVVVLGVGAVGVTGRAPAPATTLAGRPGPPEPTAPECPDAAGPAADVDGDRCPDALRFGPGWVEVEGRRFRVGRPGNALAVGDWDGDGVATVALLRRASGEVWRFATWDPEAAVTAHPAGRYPGATDLDQRDADGRDVLLVRRRNGSVTEVPAG